MAEPLFYSWNTEIECRHSTYWFLQEVDVSEFWSPFTSLTSSSPELLVILSTTRNGIRCYSIVPLKFFFFLNVWVKTLAYTLNCLGKLWFFFSASRLNLNYRFKFSLLCLMGNWKVSFFVSLLLTLEIALIALPLGLIFLVREHHTWQLNRGRN